jgi:hypothetical protein
MKYRYISNGINVIKGHTVYDVYLRISYLHLFIYLGCCTTSTTSTMDQQLAPLDWRQKSDATATVVNKFQFIFVTYSAVMFY